MKRNNTTSQETTKEISRREMLKKGALAVGAIVLGGALKNVSAFSRDASVSSLDPQNQQRIVRKALFVEKNCLIYQQGELIKSKKAKGVELKECNACVTVCPRKSITTKEIKGAKGQMLPVLDETTCIGCGRCLKVCPQDPKAWEIWDRTNNKKLM